MAGPATTVLTCGCCQNAQGEQIFYSAKLRNPEGTAHEVLENIVEDVLNVMQLLDVQHSLVGNVETRGISGGQRKRVNIGASASSMACNQCLTDRDIRPLAPQFACPARLPYSAIRRLRTRASSAADNSDAG